jgi:hypothetical protein
LFFFVLLCEFVATPFAAGKAIHGHQNREAVKSKVEGM